MDTLSSCYFCSTALDASLDEYPVVPDRLRTGDPDQTVVLCDTCARKLDAVFESVVGAVERDVASGTGSEAAPATDRSDAAADDSLETTLGDDEDVLQSVGDDASAESDTDGASVERAESSDDAADDTATDDDSERKERKYTESRGAGFRRDDDGGPTSPTLRDDSEEKKRKYSDSRGAGWRREDEQRNGTSGSASADESGGESSSTAAESGDESGENGGRDASEGDSDEATGGNGDSGGGGDSGGSGSGGSGEPTPDVSMSRLENTKVMRLLENREFPVDKDEFVTVAASAYQISREDCEKVLDLAVQHELIHEEDGQLVGGEL